MKKLLLAEWIAPMSSPIVREGGILISAGRVVESGRGPWLRKRHPDALAVELGQVVVLPGLVNAHVHLELSHCRADDFPSRDFGRWLMRVVQSRGLDSETLERAVAGAVSEGIRQCLRFGVTTAGDISRNCAVSRAVLGDSRLRAVSYGEVQAMAQRRGMLPQRLLDATDAARARSNLRIGITPHAPYTVEEAAYRACLESARSIRAPIATHLAETEFEAEFLARHTGPFRELWEALGWWDDRVPRFEGGPIRFARQIGLLDHPTLLAHVNYCDDGEMEILSRGRASVVYCPRTHAYFGHPPHRWRQMLAGGINVAVGTDSCASSPDLNLVDDLRLLHRMAPEVSALTLWQMVTVRAARAIEWESEVGSLAAGRWADLAIFAVTTEDPLREVLESDAIPAGVWVGGCPVT